MSIPPSTGGPPQRFPNPHGHFDDSSNKPPFGQQSGQGARAQWQASSILFGLNSINVIILFEIFLKT
jgi:hypothetical protein